MGMQDFVIFPMVGFLEEDIGANACFFELTVIFHGCRGDVDIDAANSPVFMFDTVNSMDTFKNVFNRIVDRVLACFKGQALVPISCRVVTSRTISSCVSFFRAMCRFLA